ncbi:MAG: hypothetical protein LPK07_14025 [Hymenobacteraceae bacterium]|nr:hypothetical protein [Hymenobacteraceae bacterium]
MQKMINFKTLASGTPLETPKGAGTFLGYKQGNFRKQNVLVEHPFGKQVWYTEDALSKTNRPEPRLASYGGSLRDNRSMQNSFVLLT